MSTLFWICTAGLVLLGALGLLEKVVSIRLKKSLWWFLIVLFFVFSIAQICISVLLAKKGPEALFSQRVTETFPLGDSNTRLAFTNDTQGRKNAVFLLSNAPIANSVSLMEGGYPAPPDTLSINSNRLVFNSSSFSNQEDYSKGQSMYRVSYMPRP